MNLRPSGYEPDELPDCSTPREERAPLSAYISYHMGGLLSTIIFKIFLIFLGQRESALTNQGAFHVHKRNQREKKEAEEEIKRR